MRTRTRPFAGTGRGQLSSSLRTSLGLPVCLKTQARIAVWWDLGLWKEGGKDTRQLCRNVQLHLRGGSFVFSLRTTVCLMGVPGLWPLLSPAVEATSLLAWSEELLSTSPRRGAALGVDASLWLFVRL